MGKNLKHFAMLSGLAVGTIYGINKFIDMTASMRKTLSTTKGRYFEWKYGNIYYSKQGSGSPLLLIHDLQPASSSVEWTKVVHQLAVNHTVYTIDLLGCGHSDKPNLTYTNYMYVQLLTDFITKIVEEKTDVIATGDSCSFALMAANMNDTIIDKLFFISPSSLERFALTPSKELNLVKKIYEIPIIGTFAYNIQMQETNIEKLFTNKYYLHKQIISSKIKDQYYEAAHLGHGNGRFLFGSIAGNYTNINIIPALKKIENPIFIISSRDNEESIRIVDSYTKYDETIETASISNCRMLPQLEDPEKLCDILKMFYN